VSMFTPTQQAALQTVVVDAFGADDLAQLSRYHLGQRLEVLVNTNQGLAGVAFALIQFVESRGWTQEFVRGVYEERKDNPAVQQFCQANAPFVFTPRASTNDLARTVGTGLAAVAGRLSQDGDAVRAILVGQAHLNLADLGTQFTRLRKYKSLHDCLHSLQFTYARLIQTGIKSFVESPEETDNLLILFGEMADELAQTRPEAEAVESRVAELVWLNVADESVRRMRAAVAGPVKDPKAASAGYAMLEGILRVQPTRINELLTGVLERLALERLRGVLDDLGHRLGGDVSALAGATTALGSLIPRLNGILSNHKDWQLVDNTLLQIEIELKLGSPLEQCAFLWSEADKILQPILDRERGAAWTDELRKLGSDLGKAFAAADGELVKPAFRRLRPRAMWYFFQADKELKELSTELDKLGGQLGIVLQEV
jgi:hypothetical protein